MNNSKVTVFTPTYNRGNIIANLYESLLTQSNKQFEWIVYDDGSTDNTKEIIESFKSENLIKIRYIYSENKGKHIAINNGSEIAKGDLFFIVDSDDILTSDAIENIIMTWESIDDKQYFAGVAGLKYNLDKMNENIELGSKFVDLSSIEFQKKYPFILEKAEVYSTKILRKYKFPEFKNENFMAESVVWNKIANDGLIIRWFNKKIYGFRYTEDGLTMNFYQKRIDNIRSTCYTYNVLSTYTSLGWKKRIGYKINYFRYGLKKIKLRDLYEDLNDKKIWFIYFFIGLILMKRDNVINKN